MDDERIELARQVMQGTGEHDWDATIERESFSPALLTTYREAIDAWGRGDLDWVLEHTDPAVEITQPSAMPDARTYHGHDGVIECILDWPQQWDDFDVEPIRSFAADDENVVVVSMHRGRARHIDVQVEAEVVWLQRFRDGLLTRWDMFMTLDDALAALEER